MVLVMVLVTVLVMVLVVVMVAITVTDHHDLMMTTDISVVLVIAVSEVNRYAALFGEHYWPIRWSRCSKRGTTYK
jgi:hypothetical protein